MKLLPGWMLVAALGTLTATQWLEAQWPAEIVPGARVQARLPEMQYQKGNQRGHLLRGRVSGLSSDTLYLAITDSVGQLAVPRHLIQRLDYSRGVPSRLSSALTRGLVGGAVLAATLALLNEVQEDPSTSTGDVALIGAAIGFGTGAILGAIFPTERWKSVKLGVRIER
ncbi:MAG TPA: hypothetical protein VFB61_00180 [Gemmatimonadales bacterium]|nr:hypothetical protein [Gemmatimonadales bacterium]